MIYAKQMETYLKRVDEYLRNTTNVYTVILGQCTDVLVAKLEGEDTYDDINRRSDAIDLLKSIREVVFEYKSQRYPFISIHFSKKQYYSL